MVKRGVSHVPYSFDQVDHCMWTWGVSACTWILFSSKCKCTGQPIQTKHPLGLDYTSVLRGLSICYNVAVRVLGSLHLAQRCYPSRVGVMRVRGTGMSYSNNLFPRTFCKEPSPSESKIRNILERNAGYPEKSYLSGSLGE